MSDGAPLVGSFQAFLAGAWDTGVREGCPEIADGPPFRTVVVQPADDPGTARHLDGFVDWWPIDRLPLLQRSFDRQVVRAREGFPYPVCAGSAHTARLLWDLRWRDDLLPAVWLAAFVLETQSDRGVGPVWETPVARRLLSEVFDDCSQLLVAAGVPLWHHAYTGQLPGARAAAWQLRRLGVTPTSRHAAVAVAHICTRLLLAERTPVRLQVAGAGTRLKVLSR